ncbi:MAG: hypothetical protein WBU20_21040, partial [Candidatus Acidiferrum sp.]
MRYLKYAALLGVLLFTVAAGSAHAQVAVGVRVGPVGVAVGAPPVCAYGYYSYYPYACAPYGYYGPSWFVGGAFIGAGPWYHGHWGPGWRGGYYGRPGYGYRPGRGYRPGYAYRAPARGFVGGGHAVGGYHGGGGGFHGGAVHG